MEACLLRAVHCEQRAIEMCSKVALVAGFICASCRGRPPTVTSKSLGFILFVLKVEPFPTHLPQTARHSQVQLVIFILTVTFKLAKISTWTWIHSCAHGLYHADPRSMIAPLYFSILSGQRSWLAWPFTLFLFQSLKCFYRYLKGHVKGPVLFAFLVFFF